MKRAPREIAVVAEVALFLLAATLAVAPVAAQQVTGELGSPSATVTIKGDRLPAPPLPFGGGIKESATESKPWWPPRVEPPKGYSGVNSGINSRNAPNILGTSYTITAEVDVPQGGGDGMLVTTGGRWGGYGLYLLKGKPVFDYNMLILAEYRWEGQPPLSPGKHTIVYDYTYDGPGIAKGGTGVLKVDGQVVDTQKQPNSIAFLQVADETFDVGVDSRTGVNDKDYQVPFPFNGTINKGEVQSRADAVSGRGQGEGSEGNRHSQRLGHGRTRTPKQARRTGSAW
jgi:hypothetical protein